MVIQAKKITEGLLATTFTGSAVLQRISHSSDAFESRAGYSPDSATLLVVSLLVQQRTSAGSEGLAIDLFHSEDAAEWEHLTELASANLIPGVGQYEFSYTYPYSLATPPVYPILPVRKFLRLQFSVAMTTNPSPVTLPYPTAGIRFDGVCWASVVHL